MSINLQLRVFLWDPTSKVTSQPDKIFIKSVFWKSCQDLFLRFKLWQYFFKKRYSRVGAKYSRDLGSHLGSSDHSIYLFIHVPYTIYNTWHKQHYGLHLRKFVHSNLPQAGFELGSLGSQAGMLPIELPLLVIEKTVYSKSYLSHVQLEVFFRGIFVWVVNSFSFE